MNEKIIFLLLLYIFFIFFAMLCKLRENSPLIFHRVTFLSRHSVELQNMHCIEENSDFSRRFASTYTKCELYFGSILCNARFLNANIF